MTQAEIAIIGGSGLYDVDMIENAEEIRPVTPFGPPSDAVMVGTYKGKRVAFLSRHGRGHKVTPATVNYRANIWALKQLGVKAIFASNASGSLQERYKPGELVLVDQFIDRTKSRPSSFYEGKEAAHLKAHGLDKVCHISSADPFCPELRSHLAKVSKQLGLPIHTEGTYVCIEGPRFSTRAESKMFRMWGGDVIGMTVFPECVLAREAGICYASVALVTDYDVWAEKAVENIDVIRTMKENVHKVKQLFAVAIEEMPAERKCGCAEATKNAFM
jgi:5'-methylthioadenosine phosphorylase